MRSFLRFIPLTRARPRLRNHIRHCHFTLLYRPPPMSLYTMRYRGRPPQLATTPLIFTILTLCMPITITRLMVFFSKSAFRHFFFAYSSSRSTRAYLHTEPRVATIHAFWFELGRDKTATARATFSKNSRSIYRCCSRRGWCAESARLSDISGTGFGFWL